jgi:hypothetical protein
VATRVRKSSRVWMSYSIMKEQNRRTARNAAVSSWVRRDRPAWKGRALSYPLCAASLANWM